MNKPTRDLDALIIEHLRVSGRASNREIARTLGVSENTVRQRVKRLEESKKLRIALICDPWKLGITGLIHARLAVAPAKLKACTEAICSLPETAMLARTSGAYNLFAVFTAANTDAINEFILTKIRPIAGITEISISPIVESLKHRYDLAKLP